MNQTVSIIIPTFNRLKKLIKAIESVKAQNYKDYEIIIIDNMSSDGTKAYIQNLKEKKIKFYQINNNGNIAKSRNLGIKKAIGKYISFLDSDDFWSKNKLNKVINKITKANLDLVYHDMNLVKKNFIFKSHALFRILEKKNVYEDLINNGPAFSTSSVLVKKTAFDQIGNFKENKELITWEDFDAWIRLSKKTNKFGFIEEKLGTINIDNGNTLKEKNKIKNIFEFKKKYLRNKRNFPYWCLVSLFTSHFKLKKYSEAKVFYKKLNLSNRKISLKLIIIFYFCCIFSM